MLIIVVNEQEAKLSLG